MKSLQWKPLLLQIFIVLAISFFGQLFAGDSRMQYDTMYQPYLAPPGWLFPIVWSVLYLLMAISAYLISISDDPNKKQALTLYYVQLFFNLIWPLLFFRFDAYLLAFLCLVILWFLIYLTYNAFSRISPLAGYLLLPYLLWVTFAGYLNLAIALNSYW